MTDNTARKSKADENARRAKNSAQADRAKQETEPSAVPPETDTDIGDHSARQDFREKQIDPQFVTIEGEVHSKPGQPKHQDAPWVEDLPQPKSARISASLIVGLVVVAVAVTLILVVAI